jgi:hypothetical protein
VPKRLADAVCPAGAGLKLLAEFAVPGLSLIPSLLIVVMDHEFLPDRYEDLQGLKEGRQWPLLHRADPCLTVLQGKVSGLLQVP